MTNDLGDFLLAASCLFGGIATLLFFLAAVDPQTHRTGLPRPTVPQAVQGQTEGRPMRLGSDDRRDTRRVP